MLTQVTYKIEGISPLLMHNGQTADPLNKFSKQMKEISGKRKKTDDDHAEMSRIEWHAGLYVNGDGKLIIPSLCIEAAIVDGAKKSKLGKAFKSAVFVEGDMVLDIGRKYGKAVDLWGNEDFVSKMAVRIGMAKVMRTRPIFTKWGGDLVVSYDNEQVNEADVTRAVEDAGTKCGVGDFRPRYGRFLIA